MASSAAPSAGRSTARKADGQEDKTNDQKGAAQERVLHLPDVHLPDVHLPDVRVPKVHVPVPGGMAGRVLWWGGLAGLAAFGVVEWPVAALVGAGSWVAERYAKAAQRPGGDRAEAR